MAIVTNTEVFDFCGTPADVRNRQGAMVTALIDQVQYECEKEINRSVETYSFTDVALFNGSNCSINSVEIKLFGKLQDTYILTNVKVDGMAVAYYVFDQNGNRIIRNDGDYWDGDITITGVSRLGGPSGDLFLKNLIIQMVGIRTGLWKKTIITEGGRIEEERSYEDDFKKLSRYKRTVF